MMEKRTSEKRNRLRQPDTGPRLLIARSATYPRSEFNLFYLQRVCRPYLTGMERKLYRIFCARLRTATSRNAARITSCCTSEFFCETRNFRRQIFLTPEVLA